MVVKSKKVKTIPATLTKYTATPISDNKTKRKTAGYARVSTDHDDQFTSYAAQIDYYTNYIKGRDDWEFVKVYTDEGITGTSTKHREGFKQMIADALDGKIDLIITKSVSRFARNTVDSLTTIRQLKENGIEVYFEKENIWTFDGKGELLLTIMSSLAQEESRSISENCTWGQRKRFSDGKATVPFTRFLGYDRAPDGSLVVNQEQAVVVKRIYSMFLQGMTYHGIAKQLTADGVKTPGGKDCWSQTTIKSILTNEKYKGDALLQKSYTVDYLTKKKKINEGEIPQYYVEGDHEAIIEPDTFDMVQREILRRENSKSPHMGIYPFSSKIKCGSCGSWYGSKVWHSNSKYRKIVWQCSHKFDKDKLCKTPHLYEKDIESLFMLATNKLLSNKKTVIKNAKEMTILLFDTTELEKKRAELIEETELISDMVQAAIKENATTALNQEEFQKRYDSLSAKFDATKEELEKVTEEIDEKKQQKAKIDIFIKQFNKSPDVLSSFSLEAWNSLVDYITVYSKDNIVFTFKNGQEIKTELKKSHY